MEDMQKKLELHFPNVKSEMEPMIGQVLLQVIYVPERTSGGIILGTEQEAKQSAVAVSKIVAIGASAFCHKLTGEKWNGIDIKIGDFVVAPQTAGMRFKKRLNKEDKNSAEIHFILCRDTELRGKLDNPFALESVY